VEYRCSGFATILPFTVFAAKPLWFSHGTKHKDEKIIVFHPNKLEI